MCGIFGVFNSPLKVDSSTVKTLVKSARERGRDSSGIILGAADNLLVYRADFDINKLAHQLRHTANNTLILGHSRLITNSMVENQPVYCDGVFVLHNGIICNLDSVWNAINEKPKLEIDTEIIARLVRKYYDKHGSIAGVDEYLFGLCEGVISACVYLVDTGELSLVSNNGSLYCGELDNSPIFSSEISPLIELGATKIEQIIGSREYRVEKVRRDRINFKDIKSERLNLIPAIDFTLAENFSSTQGENLAKRLKRCVKCVLPSSMPFIEFDSTGVCNYCSNYKPFQQKGTPNDLRNILISQINNGQNKFLMPFSGGRDSSYALHLAVNELGLKPVTYTYDWGMVTDLGRRNISRMSSKLKVENIVVASDIAANRLDVRRNLVAWLKNPDLGMLNILTAGEKHFFRYNEVVKKRLGIHFNIWGTCPFETTHFKSGFLGIPPSFASHSVYRSGLFGQAHYQYKRFTAMLKSPGYFNTSIFRNLQGEYYRSIAPKEGYIHIFDYFPWIENEVNDTLAIYNWEHSPDTSTTWRIGDASAAFYNYVYHHLAGFSEHDTFRSNQIREGKISRNEGIRFIAEENKPRLPNIKWYLNVLGLDFEQTMAHVNKLRPIVEV